MCRELLVVTRRGRGRDCAPAALGWALLSPSTSPLGATRAGPRLGLFRGGGVGLISVGLLHTVATPHSATLIRRSTTADVAQWLAPPMLLNHLLAGVLLITLGYLTV